MELYRKIIYRVLKCKKDYEPINYDDDFIHYMNLSTEISQNEYDSDYDYARAKSVFLDICIHKYNSEFESKFSFYKDRIEHPFITSNQRKYMEDIFCAVQKCYFGLLRFRELFKHKYYKTQINTDMGFTEISETSKNVICIVQHKKKYLFKMTDIFKILNDKMTGGDDFFITPIPIKNPYNNIHFSKADLYNFYFKMKFDTLYFNEILYNFFKVDFNIYEFQEHNMSLLKEQFIKDDLRNLTTNVLYIKILRMIDFVNSEIKIRRYKLHVSPDFDKKLIINVFTPYYKLYLLMSYSNDFFKINYYETLFFYKMKRFIMYNNRFGRVKHIIHNDKTHQTPVNDKYVEFYETEDNEEFKDNHIQIIKLKPICTNIFKRDTRVTRIIETDDSSESENENDDINIIINNNNNRNTHYNDLVDTESDTESERDDNIYINTNNNNNVNSDYNDLVDTESENENAD